VGGPDAIENDIDNAFAALDPAKTFTNGAPGGIGWENTKGEIKDHKHDALYSKIDHTHDPGDAATLNGGAWETDSAEGAIEAEGVSKTVTVPPFSLWKFEGTAHVESVAYAENGTTLSIAGDVAQTYTVTWLQWVVAEG
jgi:hypothetical protein